MARQPTNAFLEYGFLLENFTEEFPSRCSQKTATDCRSRCLHQDLSKSVQQATQIVEYANVSQKVSRFPWLLVLVSLVCLFAG